MSQRDVEQTGTQYKFTTQNLHIKIEPLTHNEDTTHVHTQHMDTDTKSDSEKVMIKEEPIEHDEYMIELQPIKDEPNDDELRDTQVKSDVPPENVDVDQPSDSVEAEKSNDQPSYIPKIYKCNICIMAFYKFSQLQTHMRFHDEKPHKCDINCSNIFAQTDTITNHLTDTGEKLFKCNICEKTFKQINHLRIHTRTHTDKPHICSTCKKAFSKIGGLKIHMRIHTAPLP